MVLYTNLSQINTFIFLNVWELTVPHLAYLRYVRELTVPRKNKYLSVRELTGTVTLKILNIFLSFRFLKEIFGMHLCFCFGHAHAPRPNCINIPTKSRCMNLPLFPLLQFVPFGEFSSHVMTPRTRNLLRTVHTVGQSTSAKVKEGAFHNSPQFPTVPKKKINHKYFWHI